MTTDVRPLFDCEGFLFDLMDTPIIYRNLQWIVTHEGHLICTDHNYEIDRSTFATVDWIAHMKEKHWCNDFYFRQAYEYSLANTVA